MDGLEKELAGRALVVRLNVASQVGREAAYQYRVRALPTFLVFDGGGRLVWQRAGRASKAELMKAMQSASRDN